MHSDFDMISKSFKMFGIKYIYLSKAILILIMSASVMQIAFSHGDDIKENSIHNIDGKETQGTTCMCEDKQSTFFDRWVEIYEQGKNVPISKHVKHINETTNVLKTFKQNIGFLLKPSINSGEMEKALKFFSKIDLGLSNSCSLALTQVITAIANEEIWALKFLDSYGRLLPSGFAEGLQSDFGEYSECLGNESPKLMDESTIKGRYCLMKTIIPFPPIDSIKGNEPIDEPKVLAALQRYYGLGKLSNIRAVMEGLFFSRGAIFQMGICIPSQCSAQEIQHLLNVLLFPITRIPLEVGPQCHVKDETKPLDKYQIISIIFFAILCLFVIMSTGYEIYVKTNPIDSESKNEDKSVKTCDGNQLLTSFSIIRNTRLLFAKSDKFVALDTFRLLIVIYAFVFHCYLFALFSPTNALKRMFSEALPLYFQDNKYIFARNASVLDLTMTLSGFLMSFSILIKMDKTGGNFNYLEFISQRWKRFNVLQLGALPFYLLFPLTGDGPVWDVGVNLVAKPCQNLMTFLKMSTFMNNFAQLNDQDFSPMCMPIAWYISTLMQFTVIGPIFVIIYHRNSFYGIIALITAIIFSLFASIAPKILFNITPILQIWELETMLFDKSESIRWWHTTPNNYCTGFFVGIAFGYLMRKNIQISRSKSTLFWISSTVFCTAVYFWHNSFWRLDRSAPLISVLLWYSIGKFIFCMGFGWMLLACSTGRGGYLNKILSWRVFQPLARLSFGYYLFNFVVIMHRLSSKRYGYDVSPKNMLEQIIIDFVYCTILAYFYNILIESPYDNIVKHFERSKVKSVVQSNGKFVTKVDQNKKFK